MPDVQRTAFIEALRGIQPPVQLVTEPEGLRPYECDGLSGYRQLPSVVALPTEPEQVGALLRLCRAWNVPVVPRGAGTGLSGGATPHRGGLVLSTARLNRILAIDPAARTARVQPGVRNLAISEASAALGLYYAPDPSSQIACTIGGNVAENSGGVHCLKYGLTVHNILQVKGYTIDGEPFVAGSAALDSPGFDLLALLIGSEGMLAVATEVLVKLIPKPQVARVIMASFAEVEKAGQAVADLIAAGIIPAGLEMMDKGMTEAVEEFVRAGYDTAAEAILLCESDGTPEEVEEEIGRMKAVLTASGATDLRVSESEEERLRFWSGRKNAFPASGRLSPDYYCIDGTIPRRQLGEMLRRIAEMEQRYGLRCINVFHAGDGNLHPLILYDASKPGEFETTEQFGAEILEVCVEMGGTVTGEHGVGLEKINSMCVQFSPEERMAFFAVKRAFDPQGLLNPGKGIPTLARCAEYGRQHVHRGGLKFPELPRF